MSNTNNNLQTQTSNVLHNAIMEEGGKDRPPMLAPGNYVQWKSIIKRYIDTKPNNELIHYCLQNPPYKFKWTEKTVLVTEGINNDIYSTVNACPNACEIRKAIKRLKQGESINVQDLETNLYWEFGKFTSQDGESLESYYLRFVTLVKQSYELKTLSYHKLYDILKQHHNKVNEIRVEILARTANPLTFVAQQQPVYHPQNHPNHYTQNSLTRSQQAATRNKGKAIVNSPPPIYDQEPDMEIYKPTNNNLRTSSNTSRAHQDNTPRINKGTGYDNQRVVNVARDMDNVGTQVVQQYGIQYYYCKEYGHVARECQKPKQEKDATYHKEKMLLCKQEEARFQLNAEQVDWRDYTDDEPDDQELEAYYLYMAKIQEVTPDVVDNSGPIFDIEPLQKEQGDTNITIDSLDMSTNRETVDQDDDDLARERDLLASLIDKLKCEINDSKNCNKLLESSNKTLIDKLKEESVTDPTKEIIMDTSNNDMVNDVDQPQKDSAPKHD
ncbi:retrovirus-related pol polyprotein from transposon TNT 1-94 [Tanacetum coccineum]|uniref:Retrovirus-related pol polyprotein from transposon TNT 1-94 n=1 Tax=Tanacetum coccineum TaxID=301880 RepID=A0ABQ4XDQ5_9ASTR